MTNPLLGHHRHLDLASLLNETQLKAATHPGGPLLIVAGAGSGKTRTLVHRVAWLVDQGVHPSSILLVTFTRKAAAEMLSRCAELVGERAGQVSGGTFHSLANMLLRRHAHLLGHTSNFAILDQDDAEALIGRIRAAELGGEPGKTQFPKRNTIMSIISQSVNCDQPLAKQVKSAFPHLNEYVNRLERVHDEYKKRKKENNQMDFDDLLVNLEAVMRLDEQARQSIAGRYRHVLVDEYQDTNPIQARITHLLGRDHGNVTAVGDEAQSIYSFRGADYRNIMSFADIFPETTIIKLEDNYRSRPEVLGVANHLLSQAKDSFKKVLRPNRDSGPKPTVIILDDLQSESQTVLAKIAELIDRGVPLGDMAVLFRAGSHSFDLEAGLVKAKIPFSKFGGRKFLEMAHIKDYLSFLRLALNPTDPLALSRILAMIEGLGAKSVEALIGFVSSGDDNFRRLHEAKLPVKRAQKELEELSAAISDMASDDIDDQGKAQLAWNWYSARLPAIYPDDAPSRLTDVEEVRDMAMSSPSLVDFLADLTLDPPNTLYVGGSTGIDGKRDDLTLSTIHSAKGLEWPHVFIISAVDGRFPSPYSTRTAEGNEEELRLMYVAVTRAKDELTITVPLAAAPPMMDDEPAPSRFLATLTSDKVQVYKRGRLVKDDAPLGGRSPGRSGNRHGGMSFRRRRW